MRILRRYLLALLLGLAAMPAWACSWGDPSRRLQDEIRAYYDADVVFLAKIVRVEHEAPSGTNPYWMLNASYEVLEVYRGKPASDGRVTTENASKTGPDVLPPNSCTGGGIGANSAGTRVLVFAGKVPHYGPRTTYKLDRFQTTSVENCIGCDDLLARMRLYAKYEGVTSTDHRTFSAE